MILNHEDFSTLDNLNSDTDEDTDTLIDEDENDGIDQIENDEEPDENDSIINEDFETFRSLGQLALDYPDISIINGVICAENKDQLEKRYITTTTNNTNALIALINEKSSKT